MSNCPWCKHEVTKEETVLSKEGAAYHSWCLADAEKEELYKRIATLESQLAAAQLRSAALESGLRDLKGYTDAAVGMGRFGTIFGPNDVHAIADRALAGEKGVFITQLEQQLAAHVQTIREREAEIAELKAANKSGADWAFSQMDKLKVDLREREELDQYIHFITPGAQTAVERQNIALRAALKRFHNPEDCGDHCSNFCPHCQATAALGKPTDKKPKEQS